MKRWTHKTFVEEVNKKHTNIKIIDKFTNVNSRISCVCIVDGHEWNPLPRKLLEGFGCPECAKRKRKKTHECFVSQMSIINPNIQFTTKYIADNAKIGCKCQHGHEWDATPSNLLRGTGCPHCFAESRKTSPRRKTQEQFEEEINNINPNIEIIGRYINSSTRISCKCKFCNSEFYITPGSKNCNAHFNCPYCGDGISYPNKYVRNVLKQLPIDNIKVEYKSSWTEGFIYDNYFEYNGQKYIVEADGSQHYKGYMGRKGYEFKIIKESDNIKDDLARKNGVVLIRINCFESDPEYIKNSILNSILNEIFDLSLIDWTKCHVESLTSLVFESCKLYQNNIKITEIASELNINPVTVRRYLRIGKELGLCNYKTRQLKKYRMYPVGDESRSMYFERLNLLLEYCNKNYDEVFHKSGVINTANKTIKSYKGFIFEYC